MKRLHLLTGCLASALLFSCSTKPDADVVAPGQGQLQVKLTDAPAEYKEIVITVSKVTAHSEKAGWVTLSSEKKTFDLLKLKDTTTELGWVNLPAGKVTQIRLHLDPQAEPHLILNDGQKAALKVPSGTQSGIKIKGPFDIPECERLTVTLDFDGEKSIFVHGTGNGKYIMRPVIKPAVATSTLKCDADPEDETPAEGQEGAGSPCSENSECLSNVCSPEGGTCEASPAGGPCKENSDCASSNTCTEGTCVIPTEPGPGDGKGAGENCTQDSDCLSDVCTEGGTCDVGGQGAPCRSNTDCAVGSACGTDHTCHLAID